MKDILGDYEAFIGAIDRGLEAAGIKRDELVMMDHVCYRVETIERYHQLRSKFGEEAVFLGENDVNGRMIAVFEFKEYLLGSGWTVPYLELPAPKEGSLYTEGLEHAELVVAGSLERFLDRHQDLEFDLKGMSKVINPEAGLKTAAMSVKFHEQALGAVVRIENRLSEQGIKI